MSNSSVAGASRAIVAQTPLGLNVEDTGVLGLVGDTDPRSRIDVRAAPRRDADCISAEPAVEKNFPTERLGQLHLARQSLVGKLEVLRPHPDHDWLLILDARVARQGKLYAIVCDQDVAASTRP